MFVVKYSGPFGFIKPWTAVRDGETISQQFLTPSIIMGIELKLFPELLKEVEPEYKIQRILKHRLSYKSVSIQQEMVQSKAYILNKKEKYARRNNSILKRGILINPVLHLAFSENEYAETAIRQHICLCRNEDILLPDNEIIEMTEEQFNSIEGFELIFEEKEDSFLVGFNRYNKIKPMYGRIFIQGDPVKSDTEE
ncbi:MAG: hypothetical protein P4L27_13380 [Ignavibacteriaceae bacterium]|nr:hypothetical protein [Ignavibacteriaceae bacterium]